MSTDTKIIKEEENSKSRIKLVRIKEKGKDKVQRCAIKEGWTWNDFYEYASQRLNLMPSNRLIAFSESDPNLIFQNSNSMIIIDELMDNEVIVFEKEYDIISSGTPILFKRQNNFNNTLVLFHYDSKEVEITIYRTTKISQFMDKICSEIKGFTKDDIKIRKKNDKLLDEDEYDNNILSVREDTFETYCKYKSIILKNLEYEIKEMEKDGTGNDNSRQTKFIRLDERNPYCKLQIVPSVFKKLKQNSIKGRKGHVVSVFGSTHAGKSRIIYELLKNSKTFENRPG